MKHSANHCHRHAIAALQHARRIGVAILLLSAAILAHAQWRTAAEAMRVLETTAAGKAPKRMPGTAQSMKLLHTEQSGGHNTIYAFGRGGNAGVVLVGGLEGTGILGYTDHGDSFCTDSLPPALKDMMRSWSEQQAAIARSGNTAKAYGASREQSAERKNIDHLIQTKWNQEAPYNNLCPEGNPTGCGATMFAQIMKYYNYPKRGTGKHSYYWNGQTLSADFGATEYEWDKMPDAYMSNCYDDESAKAVATLMAHVGVACNMKYAKGGSSSVFRPDPLTTYFGYNANATQRRISGTDEDISLMYEQLEKEQPIPYCGSGQGSHAFIVDGYSDGLWGINWGWGGVYDGYFRLGALTPGSDYSYDNYAILNLVPDGSYTHDAQPKDGEFTVQTPGSLKSMLGNTRYGKLTIHGSINGEDIRELRSRSLCGDNGYMHTVGGLKVLDMHDARIVDGGVYYHYESSSFSHDYTAQKDTLGDYMFCDSRLLEELTLPASATCMGTRSVSFMSALRKLVLPSQLTSYEIQGLFGLSSSVTLEVPKGAKPIVEDNVLYLQGHKKLCTVAGKHDKVVVNEQCEEISEGAFSDNWCSITTLVIPQIDCQLYLRSIDVDKLWIAGKVESLSLSSFYEDRRIDVYLPSAEMTPMHTERGTSKYISHIYVPQSLMAKYKEDAIWKDYAECFSAIDNLGMCVDERRMALPQEAALAVNEARTFSPNIYDSRLVGQTVKWTSGNAAVATVSQAGSVKTLKKGETDITAAMQGCKAVCRVTAGSWPTVNVEQPGTLAKLIKGKDYDYIAVTGKLNGNDIRELCARGGRRDIGYVPGGNTGLKGIDLTHADIVDGGIYFVEDNGDERTCVANTVSESMFYGINTVRSLLLPNSAKEIKGFGVIGNALRFLRLPSGLEKYSEYAVCPWSKGSYIEIDAPESSCVVVKDSMLYDKDFSTLYLCLSKSKKLTADARCTSIVYGAFYNNCAVETLICPGVTLCNEIPPSLKKLWLGGTMKYLWPYTIDNKDLDIFLPDEKKMARMNEVDKDITCNMVYVPKALLATYKADANWSKHSKGIAAIEDCGIVVDECGMLLPEQAEVMVMEKKTVKPQLLDTRLYASALRWTTSEERVASVDDNGNVTGNVAGEADITASVNGITRTCRVSVKPWPTIHVEVPGTLAELVGGNTYQSLCVTGNINGSDVYELRRMCGAHDIDKDGYSKSLDSNAQLQNLDMKGANLCQGGAYAVYFGNKKTLRKDYLPNMMFMSSILRCLRLPASATDASGSAVQENYNLTWLELPEDMTKINMAKTFDHNSQLETIVYTGRKFFDPKFDNTVTAFRSATLYVRKSLLDAFRQNSVFAAAFKAIEPLDDETVDGIDAVELRPDARPAAIYNIMGQRLKTVQPGINIVNGKKVLVRK